MGRLKFYEKEDKELTLIGFNTKLVIDEKECIKITKKLSRHFKFIEPELYFWGSIDSAYACSDKNMIKLAHKPTIGKLIHELGHRYTIQKNLISEKYHTKKLMRIVKRFAKYIIKKNYWKKDQVI